MVAMTAYQWVALAEYMGNVEFQPGDTVLLRGDTRTITAHVISGGVVVDEVDIEADPSEGTNGQG